MCLRACLGARLLPQSYQCPNLSEGSDRISGQLRGNEDCPFSGVTKSGRVWRKVPESDAGSVVNWFTVMSSLMSVHYWLTYLSVACDSERRKTSFSFLSALK